MVRRLFWPGLGLSLATAVFFAAKTYRMSTMKTASDSTVHVVLIGASIGQAWNIAGWPSRVGQTGFSAESLAVWQFDKSRAVDGVLMRPKRELQFTRTYLKSLFEPPPRKPDIVILKECSSYFPGSVPEYLDSVGRWAGRLHERGLQVILATVVPVTESRSARDPGKQESLLEYNRRIREYGQERQIPVLDLEATLRANSRSGYLREEYSSGDGSHLNAAAYSVLDEALRTTLCAVRRCGPQTASSRP